MSTGHLSRIADRALETLFVVGQRPPTKQTLREAYPFATTGYIECKVWEQRTQAWRAAHALGVARPIDKPTRGGKDTATADIFDCGDVR